MTGLVWHLFRLAVVAGTICLGITPLVRAFAHRRNLLDLPSGRKIHASPTPKLGGVAIFLGTSLAFYLLYSHPYRLTGVWAGAFLLLIVGIIDDVWGVLPRFKLLGQVVAAGIAIYSGVTISFITNPLGGLIFLKWFSIPITLLWIVGITNTLNLIDGLDGLAAGIGAIASGCLAVVSLLNGQLMAASLCSAIFGACLAFLIFNFPPASIFMGDSGALVLGYLLACISVLGVVKSTMTLAVVIPIVILAIPISDTVYAIVRRIAKGQKIFQADSDHMHHQLLRLGLSPVQIVWIAYGITAVLGGSGIVLAAKSLRLL